jgi:hypothetical protein
MLGVPSPAALVMLDSVIEMSSKHIVVDGSNIATEGRSMPSLGQLDQAVREFMLENPDDVVTVVVDASFGHRINASEVDMYEEAEAAGELVSPPAGAIGRGDAFLLRIADKTGATVLSNDSFQEFHGEHEWLFDKGRLIGGKPVPGVGWIFTPRTPVRGPKSREAVKEAKRTRKTEPEAASAIPGLDLAAERARGKGKGKKTVERAIAVATEEAVEPKVAKRRRRRSKGGAAPAEPVNEPLAFITFIAAHPLGTEVEGTVDSFASHGAFVNVDGARCYLPLSAMGDPPPRSGREIFARGDSRRFVVQALDPQRRGVELALPGFVRVAGWPTDETVEAEIAGAADEPVPAPAPVDKARKRRSRRGQQDVAVEAEPATPVALAAGPTAGPAKRGRKAAGAVASLAEPTAVPTPEGPVAPARTRTKKAAAKAPAVDKQLPARPRKAAAVEQQQPARPRKAAAVEQPQQTGRTAKAAAKAPAVEQPRQPGRTGKAAAKASSPEQPRQPARPQKAAPQKAAKKASTEEPAKRVRSSRQAPSGAQPQAAKDAAARAAKKGVGAGAAEPAKATSRAEKGQATPASEAGRPARAAKQATSRSPEPAQPVRAAAAKKAPTDTAGKSARLAKAEKAAKTAKAVDAAKAAKASKAAPPGTTARAAQATKVARTPAPTAKAAKVAKKTRQADGSVAGTSGSGQPSPL